MATFLMLPRSRGAIGRVRATPGALPTAGRRSDGPDGRVDGIPGGGRGLRVNAVNERSAREPGDRENPDHLRTPSDTLLHGRPFPKTSCSGRGDRVMTDVL